MDKYIILNDNNGKSAICWADVGSVLWDGDTALKWLTRIHKEYPTINYTVYKLVEL